MREEVGRGRRRKEGRREKGREDMQPNSIADATHLTPLHQNLHRNLSLLTDGPTNAKIYILS